MASKLNVAVVGTGGIFKWAHAQAWKGNPDAQLVALCDIVREKAAALADEYEVKHVFSDYRDVIKMPEVDVVDICTSNLYHSEIAVAALQAGKHVFCEKPDAINPAEAQRMADAAKASGKLLMVMRNNRFSPASQFLKKFIDAGHMGEVYTGRCGWVRRRGIPGKGGWFTTKALSGGGPLIDLGVHMIDLAIWLMGNPRPVSVVGAAYNKFASADVADSVHAQFGEAKSAGTFDVEDLATGFIRFDNGATLQVEVSWASNIEAEQNFVELRGTKAGSSWKSGQLGLFTEIEGTLCDISPRLGKENPPQHTRNINHFVDCLLRNATPIFRPEDGVNMIKILSAMYESARTGGEVKLA